MENKIKFEIKRKLTDEEIGAIKIVKTLQKSSFEAYFAGGAVRDELLGLAAHDIDIATDAKPEEIKKLFSKSYDRGKDFGVVAVKLDKAEFEVATFRSDIGTTDHRRPQKIKFVSAKEDALRRDFTINGLFYDPVNSEIIDFVQGLKDLKRKIICFIGIPDERLEEDYLRMLRAVRFASRLNFKIEEKSRKAIAKNADKITQISAERIRDEINKIFTNKNRVWAIKELDNIGLLTEILPELLKCKNVPQPLEFHGEGDVWTHIMLALNNIEENSSEEFIWAVLLHDIAKPETLGFRSQIGKTSITFFDHDIRSAEMAKKILSRLRFSHHFIKNITWAISQHMRIINAFRGMSVRKQEKLFSDPNIKLLLDLTKADLSASLRPNGKPEMKMYEDAVALKEKFEKEATELEKKQVKKFDLVSGFDIMKVLSIKPSPEVGEVRADIEQQFLDGRINTRDEALEVLEKMKK